MQPASRRRRTLVFIAAAVLLAIAIGYWQFQDAPVARNPLPQQPVDVADSTTAADSTADTATVTLNPQPAPTPAVRNVPQETSRAKSQLPVETQAEQPSAPAAEEPKPAPAKPPACDQLVLRDGDLIDVHVTEVGVQEIRYKRCGFDDGPNYVVLRRDVLSIRYSNGEVERLTP